MAERSKSLLSLTTAWVRIPAGIKCLLKHQLYTVSVRNDFYGPYKLKGPALMAEWSKALPLTASCLSQLSLCPDHWISGHIYYVLIESLRGEIPFDI